MSARVYLGTILLEPHRWRGEPPALRLAPWLPRIAAVGFDGLELWERHHAEADAPDQALINQGPPPVAVLNGYASWGDTPADVASRERTRLAIFATRAPAVKFNFGPARERRAAELAAIRAWAATLPAGVRLLCECHARTLAEDPAEAAALLTELADLRPGAIVHLDAEMQNLTRFCEVLGPWLEHVHVAASQPGGQHIPLRELPALDERLRLLAALPRPLSYTLEFTAGTRQPDESPDLTWPSACADLATLRSALAALHRPSPRNG